MGRPPSAAAAHFGEKYDVGKSRMARDCNYCEVAKRFGVGDCAPVSDRKKQLENHLSQCLHAPAWVRTKFLEERSTSEAEDDNNDDREAGDTAAEALSASKKKQKTAVWETSRFHALLLQFQHDNLLPDRFIEKASTQRLFEHLCPGIALPSRRKLGGTLLKEYAGAWEKREKMELALLQNLTKSRVNLLSDGWQNVSRLHLLGSQLKLFTKTVVFRVDATGSEHDGIVGANQLEELVYMAKHEQFEVGAIVTDDAGQCSRARELLGPRWPQIVFLKCFAHDINNLVKAVLKKDTSFHRIAEKAAAAVNALNGSSSKWLLRALDAMSNAYGDRWMFITLCETRWNSMQGCFASLLRVKKAMKVFHDLYCGRRDYPAALNVFGDTVFWIQLKIAEEVIRPLSRASFRLQRDENTLADVVISYQDIYTGFSHALMDREILLECLESRWKSCEQPLFLLALFLHPDHRVHACSLLQDGRLTLAHLTGFAVYYYRRLVGGDPGFIGSEVGAWFRGTLTKVKASRFRPESRLWEFWSSVKDEPNTTAEKLPELAMRVLAVAVNTATCERLFSEFGAIHTPTRNRLSPLKVKFIQLVREMVRNETAFVNGVSAEFNIVDATEKPESKTPQKKKAGPKKKKTTVSSTRTQDENGADEGIVGGGLVGSCSPSAQDEDAGQPDYQSDDNDSSEDELSDELSAVETIDFWTELLESMYRKKRGQSDSLSALEDMVNNEPSSTSSDEDDEDDDDDDDDLPLFLDGEEEILPPVTGPIVDDRNKRKKKEAVQGMRGWKIKLSKLFGHV